MNVGDLRKMIHGVPDEMPVVVDGYEGGIDEAHISVKMVGFTTAKYDLYGPHSLIGSYCDDGPYDTIKSAIYVSRYEYGDDP
jgi:hypothetical protein